MERRFNDTDWQPSMSNGSKNMSSSTISDSKCVSAKNNDDYHIGTNEKDRLIRDLESEVEQQRQLRLADAKQVEAKAARIKVCHNQFPMIDNIQYISQYPKYLDFFILSHFYF